MGGNKMNNEMLVAKINQIEDMNQEQLHEFGTVLSMSSLDGRARMYLEEAVERREVTLANAASVVLEHGEVKSEEL